MWYTTIQDCRNDDFVSINCAVDLGLSVIPVKGGKQVLEFAGVAKKYASSVKRYSELPDWKNLSGVTWSTVSKPDMSKIKNENLKSVLSNDYKAGGLVGNGSTADAIRYEKKTNIPVRGKWHTLKGQEIKNGIQKRYNANDLSVEDKKIADAIFNDITKALNGN